MLSPYYQSIVLFVQTEFEISVFSLGFFKKIFVANAGTNKAASSSTSLNTRKLDEETETLSREY